MEPAGTSTQRRPWDSLLESRLAGCGLVTPGQLQLARDISDRMRQHGEILPLAVVLLQKGYLTLSQANVILKDTPDRLLYCHECKAHKFISVGKVREVSRCESCGVELPISRKDLFPASAHREAAGGTEAETEEELIGSKVHGFTVAELVEAGRFKGCYRGVNFTYGKEVVLKPVPASITSDPRLLESLRRTLTRVGALTSRVLPENLRLTQWQQQYFLMLNPVPGQSLDEIITQRGALDQLEVMKILAPVATLALAGHRADLIDFDFNPELIIVDEYSRPCLLDVGTGVFRTKELSQRRFRAPERIQREEYDARADIYSFGAMLYLALTGHPPFQGEDAGAVTEAILAGRHPPLAEVAPDVHPDLARLVERSLSTDPEGRPDDFRPFVEAFRRLPEEIEASRQPEPEPEPPVEDEELTAEGQKRLAKLQQISEHKKRAASFMKLKRYHLALQSLRRILDYDDETDPAMLAEVETARKAIAILESKVKSGG